MNVNNGWKISLLIAAVCIAYYIGKSNAEYEIGKQMYVEASRNDIYNQVCSDAVKQYVIAAKQGSRMQMYVQAGLCAAAFLQAQDEVNYKKWKEIEQNIGRQIGVPQY